MKLKLVFSIFIFCAHAKAETRISQFFHEGEDTGVPLFVQTTEVTEGADGNRQWNASIKDATDQVVMTEVATIHDGLAVHHYLEQRQMKKAYEMDIKDNEVTFSSFEWADGVKGKLLETKTADLEDGFIAGPTSQDFLQKNWDLLMQGKKVRGHFAVAEVLKIVDFNFTKDKETDDVVTIKMKPASFFISMFLAPIYIQLSKSQKKIVKYTGRTPLRELIDGKLKIMDADIIYP